MTVNVREKIAYFLLMSGFGGTMGFFTGVAVPTSIPITTICGAILVGTVAGVSAPDWSWEAGLINTVRQSEVHSCGYHLQERTAIFSTAFVSAEILFDVVDFTVFKYSTANPSRFNCRDRQPTSTIWKTSVALTEDSETTVFVSKLSDLTVQDTEVEVSNYLECLGSV